VAGDAAAVLAGLIGAADDDILDLLRREAAISDDPGDDPGEHVVGPQPRERAGMASERAAPTGIEISVEHGGGSVLKWASRAVTRAGAPLSSTGTCAADHRRRLHLQGICRLRQGHARSALAHQAPANFAASAGEFAANAGFLSSRPISKAFLFCS